MADKQLSTSDIIILAGGAVMLVASFLTFYEIKVFGSSISSTAWGGDSGLKMWPLCWWPVLFGVLMAVHVAITKFANVKLPEQILDFTWNQIHFVLGAVSALLMLCFLLQKFPGGASVDKGIGFWGMLLASIALVVGAVLRLQETPATGPSTTPPTSF